MKYLSSRLTPSVLFLSICASSNAAAQDLQPTDQFVYAGVGVGNAKVSDFCDDVDSSWIECEDSDVAIKAFGGFRMHRNVAFEVAYENLGEFTIESRFGSEHFGVETTGVTLKALFIAPVHDQVELFFKGGAIFWNLDATLRDSTFSVDDSESGIDIAVGAGARVSIAKQVSVRFDWDLYPNLGDKDVTGEADITSLTVGVQYNF